MVIRAGELDRRPRAEHAVRVVGAETKSSEANDPYRQALNDLCQVLLNTNEFFYLH